MGTGPTDTAPLGVADLSSPCSRYVLEIAGGEAERLGIRTGDHRTFHRVSAPREAVAGK